MKACTNGVLDLRTGSPPARGRGLKSNKVKNMESEERVAPCAGAWIEEGHWCSCRA